MGVDPQRAVCDRRGRVYGYDGLVIGDASQLPSTLGVNPQHTIMALARLRAKELLDNTHLSIKEVSWKLGFEDQLYFSRLFKKVSGISPSAYRLEHI